MLPIPDTQSTYFNPRSLHGERLRRNQYLQAPPYFNPRSLHGERRYRSNLRASTIYFNPRSLHGERPTALSAYDSYRTFQSTLPARGATTEGYPLRNGEAISIHAPCTGSDALRQKLRDRLRISIHAPCTGSDAQEYAASVTETEISIHAPCTGSDQYPPLLYGRWEHFNPRSLHGERPFPTEVIRQLSFPISIHAPCTGSDIFRANCV